MVWGVRVWDGIWGAQSRKKPRQNRAWDGSTAVFPGDPSPAALVSFPSLDISNLPLAMEQTLLSRVIECIAD